MELFYGKFYEWGSSSVITEVHKVSPAINTNDLPWCCIMQVDTDCIVGRKISVSTGGIGRGDAMPGVNLIYEVLVLKIAHT